MPHEAPHQERDGVDEEQEALPARLALRALLPVRSLREMFALAKRGERGPEESQHLGAHQGHLSAPGFFLKQRGFLDELQQQSVA
jgi:hypothetical protein